jgi:adenylate cyclase
LERKLTAILCADVYGYSRLMGENEEATLRTLSAYRKIIDSLIENHRGRFVNSAGDSVLAEFASVVEAVNCAVEIQKMLRAENANLPLERRMEFRIGVNLGDVMVEGAQIYGDGVNVAARLESLAEAGGICISHTVHDQVSTKLTLAYKDLGEQAVKNIAKPVRVYRVLQDGMPAARRAKRQRSYSRIGVLWLAGLATIAATTVIVQHISLKPPRTSASIPPQERPELPLPNIPSIAVLPFTNMSGDPKQEYFGDGISNQLIEELSRLTGLFVIARNSSFAFKGKATPEHEIGRELGVKYLLEGSIRRTLDRLRIGVELVDASSGTEMWGQRFDRPLKDVFAIQDEIIGKVVTTLGLILKLDRLNRWVEVPSTDNLEAFDDFLRAREYGIATASWTRDDEIKVRRWLEKAIALDPNFAQAYAFLAYAYWWGASGLAQWSANPQADLQHARELAQKALALDDSNEAALRLLSYLDSQDRPDQAIAEAERVVAANPNSAFGYEVLSDALNGAGRPEEALRAGEKAARLDPIRADFYAYTIGGALVEMGRHQEGITVLKRHLAAYPDNLVAHYFMIVAYAELGRDRDAHAEAAEVMRISPNFSIASLARYKNMRSHPRWAIDMRDAGLK